MTMNTAVNTAGKSKRGFASMSLEKRQEIARMGGLSVKPENRAFSKDKKLAVKAGRKGGSPVGPQNRAFTRDPALASAAGRKGGLARAADNE